MVKVPFALAEGDVGFPQTATRDRDWRCPDPLCRRRVIVKRGPIITPHFAHKSVMGCGGGGGESLIHRSTKEWIRAAVASCDFAITARCGTCDAEHVVFTGHPTYAGHTEMPMPHWRAPTHRIDVVATEATRVRAAIEVCHTHAAGTAKMAVLAAATYDQAFEVAAVDLVAAGYPTSFATVAPRTCAACLTKRRLRRCAAAQQKLDNRVLRVFRRWKERAAKRVAEGVTVRVRRVAQLWLRRSQAARLLSADTSTRTELATNLTPCIIEAPAGGGKTTLVRRMAKGTGSSCLLLTFSKDLASAIDPTPTLKVRTIDSACFSLTGTGGPLTEKKIIEGAYPLCKPWHKKRGRRHIANLATLRLQGVAVKLCASHAAVSYGINTAMRMPSWPASRHAVETGQQDVAAGYHWLFIDEHQDLNQQAINIVSNASAPTVWVGDPHQAIYQFQTTLNCKECHATIPAPVMPALPKVTLSRTFRLPQSIVDHLWDVGHRLVTTNRRGGFIRVPTAALDHVLTKDTCVLARHNSVVVEAAMRADGIGVHVVVVGGKRIAADIAAIVKDRTFQEEPGGFKAWVGALSTPPTVVQWLEAHDGGHTSEACRFSTVHRAKGSEAKHVVLVGEWDWVQEPNIYYVAHTRHTSSLIVCE